jgi:hypothetical protein
LTVISRMALPMTLADDSAMSSSDDRALRSGAMVVRHEIAEPGIAA